MPYKDRQRQLNYMREWQKKHQKAAPVKDTIRAIAQRQAQLVQVVTSLQNMVLPGSKRVKLD